MSLKKRSFGYGEGEVPGVSQASYDDEATKKKYPTILEFLTLTLWGPNDFRKPGSLILFCEEGVFKACISDKDQDAVAFVSKPTLSALLDAVEKGLAQDTLDWRMTAAARQRRRKGG